MLSLLWTIIDVFVVMYQKHTPNALLILPRLFLQISQYLVLIQINIYEKLVKTSSSSITQKQIIRSIRQKNDKKRYFNYQIHCNETFHQKLDFLKMTLFPRVKQQSYWQKWIWYPYFRGCDVTFIWWYSCRHI